MQDNQKPNCLKCKHYYITWDKSHPYGCYAWNIKTPQSPSIAVYLASSKNCQLFEEKKA